MSEPYRIHESVNRPPVWLGGTGIGSGAAARLTWTYDGPGGARSRDYVVGGFSSVGPSPEIVELVVPVDCGQLGDDITIQLPYPVLRHLVDAAERYRHAQERTPDDKPGGRT